MSSRISFRVASASALVAGFVSAVALWFASPGSVAGTAVGAIAVALATGVAAQRLVQRQVSHRLELARIALREARKRRFEALADLPSARYRDEVDALIVQVYRAGRALQEEIESLKTAESYRREFLGDVSHELRTPIFAIAGFAETLLDGALDDDRVRRRFVEKIHSNAGRLDALTRDLDAISDLETGRLMLNRAPADLRLLVQETVDALLHFAEERGVSVSISIAEDLPFVYADRERMRQVLSNLIENAIKYNDPGGRMEIHARQTADLTIRVTVSDDGIGIPPESIPRLTERFFRVDKSRSRDRGGTGLGLAIVKHILEAHSQKLSVESRPGYGSSFAFSLPMAEVSVVVAPH